MGGFLGAGHLSDALPRLCLFTLGYVIDPMLWGAGVAQVDLVKLLVIPFKGLKYIKSSPCKTI